MLLWEIFVLGFEPRQAPICKSSDEYGISDKLFLFTKIDSLTIRKVLKCIELKLTWLT